jgi:hypothetical protein
MICTRIVPPFGKNVDDRLAIFVGLQLHVALGVTVLDSVKDHRRILDGLSTAIAQNGDFNARAGRRHLVFAPAFGGGLLSADGKPNEERREDQANDGQGDGMAMEKATMHGEIVNGCRGCYEIYSCALLWCPRSQNRDLGHPDFGNDYKIPRPRYC